MVNSILEQFGTIGTSKSYEYGTVVEVRNNHIYVIETFKGLQLTIQDINTEYDLDALVLLGLLEGSANNAFILKQGNKKTYPTAENFIVANNLD